LFSWGGRISTHSLTGSKRLRSTMTQCRSPRSKARAVSKTAAQARLYGRDVSRGEALQSWGEALQPAETQTTISILSSIRVRASRACISLRPPMRGKNISTILNRVCPLQRPTKRVRPISQTTMAANTNGNFEENFFGRHGLCIKPNSEGSTIVRHADKRVGTFIRLIGIRAQT